jgi:hypothetical protein
MDRFLQIILLTISFVLSANSMASSDVFIEESKTAASCSYCPVTECVVALEEWSDGTSHWRTCSLEKRSHCHAGEGCWHEYVCVCNWGDVCEL